MEKIYTIFAGVNGAGKSTLYKSDNFNKSELRVNVDEIVQQIGDWKNKQDQITAGKMAVKRSSKRFYSTRKNGSSKKTTCYSTGIVKNQLLKK